MRSEEIDKLFKSKLENLPKSPSASAWSEVEAQLSNKKGVWFYMRIAAALLLLITFTGLYFLNVESKENSQEVLTKNEPTELIQPIDTIKTDSASLKNGPTETMPPVEGNIAETMDTTSIKPEERKIKRKKVLPGKKENLAQNKSKNEKDKGLNKMDTVIHNPTLTELAPNKELVAENNDTDATTSEKNASPEKGSDSGTTLVFDIEEFDMKTAVTKAYDVAEETKKTGFKKVLDFVKSVKEGEAGLGGLREAKNNLLSIKQKDKEDENSK